LTTISLVPGTYSFNVYAASVSLNNVARVRLTVTIVCGLTSNAVTATDEDYTSEDGRIELRKATDENGLVEDYRGWSLILATYESAWETLFDLEDDKCGPDSITMTKLDGTALGTEFWQNINDQTDTDRFHWSDNDKAPH